MLAAKVQRSIEATGGLSIPAASVFTGISIAKLHQYINRDLDGLDLCASDSGRNIRFDALLGLRLAHDYADLLSKPARIELARKAIANPKARKIDLDDGNLSVLVAPSRRVIAAGMRRMFMAISHVKSDPKILSGEPCLVGTRLSVYTIVGLYDHCGGAEVRLAYPEVSEKQLDAARVFAEAFPRRGRPTHQSASRSANLGKRRHKRKVVIA
jgi:uncharacterized protein (DUF433 family)